MSTEIEKAAHRRQPGTASNKHDNSTGRIYHIVKRAATTAGEGAPDRVPSPAALRKECASEAASPKTFSHVVILSASLRTHEEIAEKQLAAFDAFLGDADGVELDQRRQLLNELTTAAINRDAIKAKAKEAYRAAARLRAVTGAEYAAQQAVCDRLWREHDALLRAAYGGGEGRT